MEPISLTAVALFLAPFFTEAGKTLAVESVKLALEKRQDIKDKFIGLFKPDEIISLGLSGNESPDEVKALTAKPAVMAEVQSKLEANPDILKELLDVIKQQAGNESSKITINAEKIGQVISDNHGTINQTVNF